MKNASIKTAIEKIEERQEKLEREVDMLGRVRLLEECSKDLYTVSIRYWFDPDTIDRILVLGESCVDVYSRMSGLLDNDVCYVDAMSIEKVSAVKFEKGIL